MSVGGDLGHGGDGLQSGQTSKNALGILPRVDARSGRTLTLAQDFTRHGDTGAFIAPQQAFRIPLHDRLSGALDFGAVQIHRQLSGRELHESLALAHEQPHPSFAVRSLQDFRRYQPLAKPKRPTSPRPARIVGRLFPPNYIRRDKPVLNRNPLCHPAAPDSYETLAAGMIQPQATIR